jgi:hypothetical protein
MPRSPSPSADAPGTMWGRLTAKRPLLISCLKALLLFLVSLAVLVVLLRTLLPPIDPEDAPNLKIPKSFDDLKNLNRVLQVPFLF